MCINRYYFLDTEYEQFRFMLGWIVEQTIKNTRENR